MPKCALKTGESARSVDVTAVARPLLQADSVERGSLCGATCFARERLADNPVKAQPVLWQSTEYDRRPAAEWLAHQSNGSVIRLTGGCLNTKIDVAERAQRVLSNVLAECGKSMLLSGGTHATVNGSAYPCVPEIATRAQAAGREARHLAVVPGKNLMRVDGSLVIEESATGAHRFSVTLDSRVSHALVANKETKNFWDSEWQESMRICSTLFRSQLANKAVLLSFDGGVSTELECRAWASVLHRNSASNLILVTGGSPGRATDSLAQESTFKHAQIHRVALDEIKILKLLDQIGGIREPSQWAFGA